MTQRTTPPFRADHVGSLLRTAPLKEARAQARQGRDRRRRAEGGRRPRDRDRSSRSRRRSASSSPPTANSAAPGGISISSGACRASRNISAPPIKFHGVDTKAEAIKIAGKVDFTGHPQIEHFKFLKAHCRVTPKMTIPAPSTFHFRQGRAMVSKEAYPDYDEFFADIAATWQKAIRAFYDAGCRYLQLDDTAWAMICDPKEREQSKARGDDPDKLPAIYARVTNEALEGKPADMAITMHSCRGNFRSTLIASGGYEFVAEQLLGNTKLDGYFLEYDSDRAGGFEPLRYFPKGNKQLVLGLVTSKSGRLEPKDDIKRRIDEATKYVALDQLCLSPQCGFASTEEGNVLAEEEQWAKLRMIVELAEEVWGKSCARRIHACCHAASCDATNDRPFRADHVGSLLRTAPLKEARAKRENGEIDAATLKAVEDREIETIIKQQEDIGLKAVTDGEFRRAFWNYDFLGALPGVEAYLGERKIKFEGVNPKPMMLRVTGKLGAFSGHPMLEHFKFVQAHTQRCRR